MRSRAFILALGASLAVAPTGRAQDVPAASLDSAYARAAALVRGGEGDAGRQVVDSIFVRTRPGTEEHAEAMFWRASLAMDTQVAEADYRRLVVEYPLSPRVDEALLALAQLELARNDRERALVHLARLDREHPGGESRAAGAFWTARIRFDMNDAPRACASLDLAQRLLAADDVELRNQVEFYLPRCAGVTRAAAGGAGASTTGAAAPAQSAASAPAARAAAPRAATIYAVQLAAYNTAAEAEALVRRLRPREIVARVSGTTKPFRVRTGSYRTRAEASAAQRALAARGIEGFVVEEPAPASP